jgi:hypothetical protein
MVGHGTERTKTAHFVLDEFVLKRCKHLVSRSRLLFKNTGGSRTHETRSKDTGGSRDTHGTQDPVHVPVKKHRGSLDTGHTRGAPRGRTDAHGHTDHTDEPHNHPNPPTHPHGTARTTTETAHVPVRRALLYSSDPVCHQSRGSSSSRVSCHTSRA